MRGSIDSSTINLLKNKSIKNRPQLVNRPAAYSLSLRAVFSDPAFSNQGEINDLPLVEKADFKKQFYQKR
ncbi:MAG: hypothetical protein Q8R47_05895 [Nanoarchaeota archaeon]|nr:hypothetical protein [Nanoarchaeota archaeon]